MNIAVIIPLLNEAKYLSGLLHDMRQWHANEVIFVDGASSDETPRLLDSAGVQWIRAKRGRAAQMNAGAAYLNSDIFLFLHADTVLSSSNIEAVVKAMYKPEMAGGRFDIRLDGNHPAFRIIAWFINLRSRLTKISTGDQAMFVRRKVFERMGGFPEQPLMEDVEFSRRLKREGDIACLRSRVTTSSRRWEKHGIVRTILLMWWLRFRYWLGASPAVLKRLYIDAP